ncbi:MAG TPA: hypothetical protein VGF81_16570 [Solirubrobacteraceae bacterium]
MSRIRIPSGDYVFGPGELEQVCRLGCEISIDLEATSRLPASLPCGQQDSEPAAIDELHAGEIEPYRPLLGPKLIQPSLERWSRRQVELTNQRQLEEPADLQCLADQKNSGIRYVSHPRRT